MSNYLKHVTGTYIGNGAGKEGEQKVYIAHRRVAHLTVFYHGSNLSAPKLAVVNEKVTKMWISGGITPDIELVNIGTGSYMIVRADLNIAANLYSFTALVR